MLLKTGHTSRRHSTPARGVRALGFIPPPPLDLRAKERPSVLSASCIRCHGIREDGEGYGIG
jgi:hypothetical protein